MTNLTKPLVGRRQRTKGPIDPRMGERVRIFRTARGLTQARLAGDDFTKGFISLVETGRTRMSLRAAEIVASRLGVSVAELLTEHAPAPRAETELAVVRAEAELAAGRADRARELGERLLGKSTGLLRGRLLRLLGRALLRSDPRQAGTKLEEAVTIFQQERSNELLARSLFDLAEARGFNEQYGESLNLLLQCQLMLDQGLLTDRMLQLKIHSMMSSVLVVLGDTTSADLSAKRAAAMAEDIFDPVQVASIYNNLAAAREKQGDLEGALLYARRALEAYERLGDERAVGSAWNTLGWVYIKREQYDRAGEALDEAERIAERLGHARLRGYVLQNRAELRLAQGKPAEAVRLAEESIRHKDIAPRCRAISLLVRAQALARIDASLGAVTKAFNEAIEALEPYGRQMLARAYEAQFEALSARGQTREATAAARRALAFTKPTIRT